MCAIAGSNEGDVAAQFTVWIANQPGVADRRRRVVQYCDRRHDDRPFLVKTWTYAAADVPLEAEAFGRWLDERWDEVDAWVEEHAAPYLPGHEPGADEVRVR